MPPLAMQFALSCAQGGEAHAEGSQRRVNSKHPIGPQELQTCTHAPVTSVKHGPQEKFSCCPTMPMSPVERPSKLYWTRVLYNDVSAVNLGSVIAFLLCEDRAANTGGGRSCIAR
jgi:hypothetical protein